MTNHPKDRHVLAAAVTAGAQSIVTDNLRDVQAHALAPYDIEAQSPDAFLTDLFGLDPEAMIRIIHEQSRATIRPHLSVDTIMDHLARDGASRFAGIVRSALPA